MDGKASRHDRQMNNWIDRRITAIKRIQDGKDLLLKALLVKSLPGSPLSVSP